MSDLKKWRVTGPGMNWDWIAASDETDALSHAMQSLAPVDQAVVMRRAGYRAEPIEEPKMVTVRAEDLRNVVDNGGVSFKNAERVAASYTSLRAALDGAK